MNLDLQDAYSKGSRSMWVPLSQLNLTPIPITHRSIGDPSPTTLAPIAGITTGKSLTNKKRAHQVSKRPELLVEVLGNVYGKSYGRIYTCWSMRFLAVDLFIHTLYVLSYETSSHLGVKCLCTVTSQSRPKLCRGKFYTNTNTVS